MKYIGINFTKRMQDQYGETINTVERNKRRVKLIKIIFRYQLVSIIFVNWTQSHSKYHQGIL